MSAVVGLLRTASSRNRIYLRYALVPRAHSAFSSSSPASAGIATSGHAALQVPDEFWGALEVRHVEVGQHGVLHAGDALNRSTRSCTNHDAHILCSLPLLASQPRMVLAPRKAMRNLLYGYHFSPCPGAIACSLGVRMHSSTVGALRSEQAMMRPTHHPPLNLLAGPRPRRLCSARPASGRAASLRAAAGNANGACRCKA